MPAKAFGSIDTLRRSIRMTTRTRRHLADIAAAGAPKKAVLAAMTQQGRLEVKFTSRDGWMIRRSRSTRTSRSGSRAESLGVSLSGMVKGLGGFARSLLGN